MPTLKTTPAMLQMVVRRVAPELVRLGWTPSGTKGKRTIVLDGPEIKLEIRMAPEFDEDELERFLRDLPDASTAAKEGGGKVWASRLLAILKSH